MCSDFSVSKPRGKKDCDHPCDYAPYDFISQPPMFQDKQSQYIWPLLTQTFQCRQHPCGSFLHPLLLNRIHPTAERPELHTVLHVQSHQRLYSWNMTSKLLVSSISVLQHSLGPCQTQSQGHNCVCPPLDKLPKMYHFPLVWVKFHLVFLYHFPKFLNPGITNKKSKRNLLCPFTHFHL